MFLKRYISLIIPVVLLLCYLVDTQYVFRFFITVSCIPIVLWYGIRSRGYVMSAIIAAAFLFSILGDWMLHTSGNCSNHFIYGIVFFFIAHLSYIAFCLKNGRMHFKMALILVICFCLYYVLALLPVIDNAVIRVAVLIYILISCLSLAAAKGLKLDSIVNKLFLCGILCLVFSDILISTHDFLHIPYMYFLMLPAYYASQILVSAAIIRHCTLKS